MGFLGLFLFSCFVCFSFSLLWGGRRRGGGGGAGHSPSRIGHDDQDAVLTLSSSVGRSQVNQLEIKKRMRPNFSPV